MMKYMYIIYYKHNANPTKLSILIKVKVPDVSPFRFNDDVKIVNTPLNFRFVINFEKFNIMPNKHTYIFVFIQKYIFCMENVLADFWDFLIF